MLKAYMQPSNSNRPRRIIIGEFHFKDNKDTALLDYNYVGTSS
jgi:hypothetical protein